MPRRECHCCATRKTSTWRTLKSTQLLPGFPTLPCKKPESDRVCTACYMSADWRQDQTNIDVPSSKSESEVEITYDLKKPTLPDEPMPDAPHRPIIEEAEPKKRGPLTKNKAHVVHGIPTWVKNVSSYCRGSDDIDRAEAELLAELATPVDWSRGANARASSKVVFKTMDFELPVDSWQYEDLATMTMGHRRSATAPEPNPLCDDHPFFCPKK